MKYFGYSMATLGLVTVGIVGYCMLSKDTKNKADKFVSSVVKDVTNKADKMNMN